MMPSMRRHKQMLPPKEAEDLLTQGAYGVLGTAGTEGYPYAVPVSYAYDPAPAPDAPAGRVFIHCAVTGHKLDALAVNPHVSFTVVGKNVVAPEQLTNLFQSVIAFGTARGPRTPEEKREALLALGYKYCPGLDAMVVEEIEKADARTHVIIVDVEQLTGKEAIELTRERPKAQA